MSVQTYLNGKSWETLKVWKPTGKCKIQGKVVTLPWILWIFAEDRKLLQYWRWNQLTIDSLPNMATALDNWVSWKTSLKQNTRRVTILLQLLGRTFAAILSFVISFVARTKKCTTNLIAGLEMKILNFLNYTYLFCMKCRLLKIYYSA